MSKKQKTIRQLYTRWGKNLDKEHVLEEYPRPQMERNSYVCLNGMWEYAITKSDRRPERDGQSYAPICVPFSPEALLSGVNRQLLPDEYLWYRKEVPVDREKLFAGSRLILHFGAVDQHCRVYINGTEVTRHTGGYLPFSVDITKCVLKQVVWAKTSDPRSGDDADKIFSSQDVEYADKISSSQDVEYADEISSSRTAELLLVVKDVSDTSYHARGKQKLERGGMYYTAQSGIWQTVWMEYVPQHYIEEIETQPDADAKKVRFVVRAGKNLPVEIAIEQAALYDERKDTECAGENVPKTKTASAPEPESVQEPASMCISGKRDVIITACGTANEALEVTLPEISLWNCETPYLYYFTVRMGEDEVRSYFAMRTFTVEKDAEGIPRICLNHQPQFQKGVLDQGYWSDGLYTAPSDEAFICDIRTMKSLGFNMIRKHIKIEPQRWYYHCDRLGMAVWQDMVNGGTAYQDWFVTYVATAMSWKHMTIKDHHPWLLSRKDEAGRKEFAKELKATIHLLKGHPCIAAWVIFNEGWGQFATEEMTELAKREDGTRLVDSASGWFDQGCGDLQSIHNYFFKLDVKPEQTRAAVLSEFGGMSLQMQGHSACEELYGYGTYTDLGALNQAYRELDAKVQALIPKGLCASVYTQVSDVEEEVNGILTFDREVQKIQ